MSKLLVVEDNEESRDGLTRHLRRKGYEVLAAVDGRQGLEAARSGAPDLVLMDMSLPVLDGWEATRQLKADPQTRHIPVIALTAHAMAGDREKALAAGCDEYDTKPVEFARLLGKIRALLGGRAPAGGESHECPPGRLAGGRDRSAGVFRPWQHRAGRGGPVPGPADLRPARPGGPPHPGPGPGRDLAGAAGSPAVPGGPV